MAALPPSFRDEAADHYLAAIRDQLAGGASHARADSTAWRKWHEFCAWVGVPFDLAGIHDPIPLLQLFAYRVRVGILAADRRRIKKRSVEQYLRSVGQIFAGVGARDPRLDGVGAIDFRLRQQLLTYDKEDPPPTRVQPVPLAILLHLFRRTRNGTDLDRAIGDLCLMAFFFLLRPGEYCEGGSDSRTTPFRLRDVDFFDGERRYRAHQRWLTDAIIAIADFVALAFNDQKNAVKGEKMGHGRSYDDTADPVTVVGNRVSYLRAHGATGDTPLAAVLESGRW